MKTFTIAICAALIAGPSLADVRVQFLEGAPKDRFIITNAGSCDIGPSEVVIDFANTTSGLIFDVTGDGAGVEVFQPFEVTEGAGLLASMPTISDGDQIATLAINALGAGQQVAFTIDVDDTAGAREITVTDDEMDGAVITLTTDGQSVSSSLGANAETLLTTAACTT